jgi:SAM-dependent methyltransferase
MAECFLCKRASALTVWKERGYEGRLCSCGMMYTNPSPAPGTIDFTKDPHPEGFYSCSADFKAEWVARHCPRGRLLEVGCGEGFFLEAARSRGYEVFGLEPHPDRARRVRERLGIQVQQGYLEDNLLPEKSFDVVYHSDMLAHFPDPIRCLRLMSSALQDGGVLCFEVGILGGVSTLWYRLIGEIGLGPHLWLYSEQALKLLFAQAGFRVLHVQRFGLGPYVVLGKVSRLAEAVAFRLSSALPHTGVRVPLEKLNRLHQEFLYLLQYKVGAFAPRTGPLKLLVVARPEENVARN